MAKSKTRKSQKQKQMVENEVLVYIYSLVLITLSIIGGLQIGFIGELTTSIIKYVFGNLYGVIYGVIIVLCVMMMLKKSVRDVPMKYLIGIGVLLCAWIIAASIPQNETLKGMDILSRYLQDSMLIFRGEIAAKGEMCIRDRSDGWSVRKFNSRSQWCFCCFKRRYCHILDRMQGQRRARA